MSVTIKDIAEACGVSRGTVDRVLHNRTGVNAEVAARVKAVAEQMGFVPNKAGKILAARKQPITFGCLLPDGHNPFFDDVISGMRRAEAELSDYGVSISIQHVSGYESETHISAINELKAGGYSGLCLTTLDTPQVQLTVHKIIEEGIPVVSVNTDIPDSGRICYVGTDYFRAGKTAAGMLSLVSQGKLNILVITGSYNIRGHKERVRGFLSGLESRGVDFKIVDTIESFDSDDIAYRETSRAIKDFKDINCFFVAAAGTGGVCKAVDEAGLKETKILAFDEVPEVQENILNSHIDFTIGQDPELQGYMGIMRLFSWLMEEGKRTTTDYITSTSIKIAENI